MKKIILALLSVVLLGGSSMAQDKSKSPSKKKAEATQQMAPAKQEATVSEPKMKKDGTPDMRHKANKDAKTAAAPAGPLKKDGTPDMRNKANKEAAAGKK